MIGDRRFDIEAARALGLGAIGVDYGYALQGELEQAGAERIFENVDELTRFLLG